MRIQGFIGTTFLDFPNHIASAVFTAGCNFRCPFCHNPSLVLPDSEEAGVSCPEILERIRNRRGFIDGVVVSGGEPLIQEGLGDFLFQIRQLGVKVKIDTNGALPESLQAILDADLVDFVSMDIKAIPEKYSLAAGVPVKWENIERSIEIIMGAGVNHEFRTTVVPGIVSPEEIPIIAARVSGARRFAVQQFRPEITLDPSLQREQPFPLQLLREAAEGIKQYVAEVEVLGI